MSQFLVGAFSCEADVEAFSHKGERLKLQDSYGSAATTFVSEGISHGAK